jgi:hypothetical protein
VLAIQPDSATSRQAVAIGQMLMNRRLIHRSGGRIRACLDIVGSLAFRDVVQLNRAT